jgi:Alkylmercury lyase
MAETALHQQGFTAIMEFLIANGRAPHYTELSKTLDITPSEARDLLPEIIEAAGGICWFANNTRYIGAWPPFSNSPTQYLISVDGDRKWYGQCGLESLAFSPLFPGQDVQIDALTLTTADPVRVRYRDGELLDVSPATAVCHVNVPVRKWLDDLPHT